MEDIEKQLHLNGRHTYLYAPSKGENVEQVIKHLHRAGIVVLLLTDSRQKRLFLEKMEKPVTDWEKYGPSVEDVAKYIQEQSEYEGTAVTDGNYI